jgi:hypothetical protein
MARSNDLSTTAPARFQVFHHKNDCSVEALKCARIRPRVCRAMAGPELGFVRSPIRRSSFVCHGHMSSPRSRGWCRSTSRAPQSICRHRADTRVSWASGAGLTPAVVECQRMAFSPLAIGAGRELRSRCNGIYGRPLLRAQSAWACGTSGRKAAEDSWACGHSRWIRRERNTLSHRVLPRMGRVMTYCAPFVLTKASQFRTAKQGRDPDPPEQHP